MLNRALIGIRDAKTTLKRGYIELRGHFMPSQNDTVRERRLLERRRCLEGGH